MTRADRQTEVHQHRCAALVDQDVGRRDVTMDHIAVGVGQTLQRTVNQGQGIDRPQFPVASSTADNGAPVIHCSISHTPSASSSTS